MYDEDDLLPVSALQHLMYCERQCALIHIERAWRDNVLTTEGSHLHSRVDQDGPRRERRGDVLVARGEALRSFELGLIGRADVVEFQRLDSVDTTEVAAPGSATVGRRAAISLIGVPGLWIPFPVDYKHGKPKRNPCDEIQLCAQGMCLEEMLDVGVPRGALFYGKTRHRHEVTFDHALREATAEAAARLHVLVVSGVTPAARKGPKCDQCSLLPLCLPEAMTRGGSASQCVDDELKGSGWTDRKVEQR